MSTPAPAGNPPLAAGRKRFTASHERGEIVRQTLQQAGVAAMHRPGLGHIGLLEQVQVSGPVRR